MGALEIIEKEAERATGMSVQAIRATPLCEMRTILRGDDSYGGLRVSDRGYVLTSDQINGDLDRVLRL